MRARRHFTRYGDTFASSKRVSRPPKWNRLGRDASFRVAMARTRDHAHLYRSLCASASARRHQRSSRPCSTPDVHDGPTTTPHCVGFRRIVALRGDYTVPMRKLRKWHRRASSKPAGTGCHAFSFVQYSAYIIAATIVGFMSRRDYCIFSCISLPYITMIFMYTVSVPITDACAICYRRSPF